MDEQMTALQDARRTLVKTATGSIGGSELTIPRYFFDSALRNIDAATAAHSVIAGKVAELEGERSFVWKWVERAMFDKSLSFNECMSMLANYPGAPWNQGRWDVDHKPYAKKFYAAFPKARAALAPYPERRSE